MDRLKKNCLVIVKVVLIVFLVCVLNKLFMPKYINENKDGRISQEYYKEKGNADIIFVGSSTVYSGISPVTLWNETGMTSYVRANASQPLWISYYMIEDAIKFSKPELVCLDIGFSKYEDNYVEEPSSRKSIDGMRQSLSKYRCAREAMGEDEKLMDYIIPLFRFHSRWKELGLDDFRYLYYPGNVTYNGMIMDCTVCPAQMTELSYEKDGDTTLSNRNVEYLNKIIELCQNNGVQIMFFKTPMMSTNWSYDYDRQIEEIASKYDVNYVNFDSYYNEMGIDYSVHTPDGGSHLNTPGAELFTKYFGQYIAKNYNVSNHANDSKYINRWNEKTAQYENDKLEAMDTEFNEEQ